MGIIANDFVNAMRQIPSLIPASTTVQVLRTQTDDGLIQAFKETLESAGYGVRWVAGPSANNLLQYRSEEIRAAGQIQLDIAVGTIELRRTYNGLKDNLVKPVTPLYVKGADATQVVLEDVEYFGNGIVEPIVHLTVPNNINPLSGIVAAASAAASEASTASSANYLTVESLSAPNSLNVFDLGESNFEDILRGREVVIEQILTFPNDSLRLGTINKRHVDALVTHFDPSTDVFSVIGCSIGQTNIKNGNAALALGRASRVREALLFAGVEQDKILDEGCWGGDSFGITLPGRGVVVTLNRQL
jgi:hypothetical protein